MKRYLYLLAFTFCSLTANAQGSAGLVGHWNFNGSANDVSGNGLNGSVIGASLTTGYSGNVNTAYKFKGTTMPGVFDNITVPYNLLMNVQSFSICALVNADSFNVDQCQGNSIVWRGTESASDYYSMEFCDNPNDDDCFIATPNKMAFQSQVTDIGRAYSRTDFAPHNNYISKGVWYCLVTVYDGAELRNYVNGVLYHSMPYTTTLQPGIEDMRFGASMFNTASSDWRSYPFYGSIDDIKLYGRALSALEVDMYCEEAKSTGGGDGGNGGGTDWPTSVRNANNIAGIIVAPNPAGAQVQVFLQNSTSGKVQLLNPMGQVLSEKTIAGTTAVQFDLSGYATGVYMVSIQSTNGKTFVSKFIKN